MWCTIIRSAAVIMLFDKNSFPDDADGTGRKGRGRCGSAVLLTLKCVLSNQFYENRIWIPYQIGDGQHYLSTVLKKVQ